MYPLDWLEERSGLVGGVRYFLFRNVPSDVNWFQTLGSATLTAFLVQATTGVILAMYYQPGPTTAYPSILRITNDSGPAGSSAGCTSGARRCSSS